MRSRFFILVLVLSLLMPNIIMAQQSSSITQLREQIAKLEVVNRDPLTPPDVKNLNRDFLKQRRLQLHATLVKRIDALRKYLSNIGASLTAEEIRVVETSITTLEKNLRELDTSMSEGSSSNNPDDGGALTSPNSAPEPEVVKITASSINTSDKISAITMPGSLPAPQAATCTGTYDNAPEVIETEVERVAGDIVRRNDSSRVGNIALQTIFLTVADALTQEEDTEDSAKVSALNAYVYIGETTRTDKQIGTTAGSGGSTSAAEKTGWADLLGAAVERGAIQQAVNKTTLTLSTTPYAFIVPSASDTAESRRRYGYLRRLGLFASFNISDKDSTLQNAKRKNLTQYSAKLGLTTPRGPGSEEFEARWRELIKPAIQDYINILAGGIETLFAGSASGTALQDYRTAFLVNTDVMITAQLAKAKAEKDVATTEAKKTEIDTKNKNEVKRIILCSLKTQVFNEVKTDGTGKIKVDKPVRDKIVGQFVPALIESQKRLKKAGELYKQMIEDFERRPAASLSFVHNRPDAGPEYSTLSLLYQQYLADTPIKMTVNAGPSFYNRPDATMNQEKFRDFTTALSFEGRRVSPFNTLDVDLSPMTYSLTARYQRFQENRGVANKKADIAVVQFKLDIPISKGISIPLAVTYANATEQIKEQHVRGNFGLTFDMDKFFGVTKLQNLLKKQ